MELNPIYKGGNRIRQMTYTGYSIKRLETGSTDKMNTKKNQTCNADTDTVIVRPTASQGRHPTTQLGRGILAIFQTVAKRLTHSGFVDC